MLHASITEIAEFPTLNWARLEWFDKLRWQSLSEEPVEREEQVKAVGWFKNALDAPSFEGLCKTVISKAGCDLLRDEGEAYARDCVEGGCEVWFPGVPHPFLHMDAVLWQAREFIDLTAKEIRHAVRDA